MKWDWESLGTHQLVRSKVSVSGHLIRVNEHRKDT